MQLHLGMLPNEFDRTIDIWIQAIEQYNFDHLIARPSPATWSLGQVVMHLLEATQHYLDQINVCIATPDHELEEMSPQAKIMFSNNEFPDEIIEGPATNSNTPQPENKDELIHNLRNLKKEINAASFRIAASPFNGKTKHPGLHYFSAGEWLQFAEMHFRHHLRQKNRIDDYWASHQKAIT